MTKPYFDDGKGHVIYCGNSFEVLHTLEPQDLCLTDPPYGIARVWKGGTRHQTHGWAKVSETEVKRNEWDSKPLSQEEVDVVLNSGIDSIVWGGNYFPLPLSRGWLVWTKPERGFTLSEAELAWTSRDMPMRIWDGVRSDPGRIHPTQKPLDLMKWCLSFFPKAKTVIDPFMGSGTTLRACKDLGIACTGIELEEKYCEIAARRLEQEVFDFGAQSA